MSSMYDIWMQRMLKEADDHVATVEEWQALLDYLNGNITSEEAASEYTKQVAKTEDCETVYIWTLLQDVAKDFTQTHVKLIELLKAITHLPSLDHKGRNPKSGEGEFWKDLPNFEFVLREHVDGNSASDENIHHLPMQLSRPRDRCNTWNRSCQNPSIHQHLPFQCPCIPWRLISSSAVGSDALRPSLRKRLLRRGS